MITRKLITAALAVMTVVTAGCAPSSSGGQAAQPAMSAPQNPAVHSPAPQSLDPDAPELPARAEILALLSEAGELDTRFYSVKTHTEDEVYAHYGSLYTRNYVKNIVLGGGNLKEKDGHWEIAYEGGEFLEGTFINEIDEADLGVSASEDGRSVTLTNKVGDGLYAPHREIITLVREADGWKIDNLQWEK